MDTSFDATANINNIGSPGTTLAGNHVQGSGTSPIVWVFISWNAGGSISSLTYGGVAMTNSGISANMGAPMQAWYLTNPPAGTNSVSVTVTVSATIVMLVSSYFNVNPYSPVSVSATNSNMTGSSPAVTSLVTKPDRSWVIAYSRCNATSALSGSGFTSRITIGATNIFADTNGNVARDSTVTLTTTYTPGAAITGHIVIAMTPVNASALLTSPN